MLILTISQKRADAPSGERTCREALGLPAGLFLFGIRTDCEAPLTKGWVDAADRTVPLASARNKVPRRGSSDSEARFQADQSCRTVVDSQLDSQVGAFRFWPRKATTLTTFRNLRMLALAALAAGVAFGTVGVFSVGQRFGASASQSYLAVANALLVFLLVAIAILYADARRARQRAGLQSEDKSAQMLSHIFSISSARAILSAQSLSPPGLDASIQLKAARTAEFLHLLVNEARSAFEAYTNRPCAASIKLLTVGDDGSARVVSYLRDDRSGPIRRDLYGDGGSYPFRDHSPFVDIVTQRIGSDYFLENNLREAERRGKYSNSNPFWRRLYNATLILPIASPTTVAGDNIAGFLCIDSASAKFDHDVCPALGRIVATSAFLALYELSLLEQQGSLNRSGDRQGSQRA